MEMKPCFKEKELWALVEEARGINPEGAAAGLLTPEETEKLSAVLCPFCRQKNLYFIGHLDGAEATFRCKNCSFMAGVRALTEKDRTEVINEFFQTLLRTYEKTKEKIDLIMDAIKQYRP